MSKHTPGPLRVYIDADLFSPEEQGRILSLLSDLYECVSGDRLVIKSMGYAELVIAGDAAIAKAEDRS